MTAHIYVSACGTSKCCRCHVLRLSQRLHSVLRPIHARCRCPCAFRVYTNDVTYDIPKQATLLAEKHGLKVCIIDPNLEKRWIPNYGVWVEEWEALDKDLQVHQSLLTWVPVARTASVCFHGSPFSAS